MIKQKRFKTGLNVCDSGGMLEKDRSLNEGKVTNQWKHLLPGEALVSIQTVVRNVWTRLDSTRDWCQIT
jgi:hypothetical protein